MLITGAACTGAALSSPPNKVEPNQAPPAVTTVAIVPNIVFFRLEPVDSCCSSEIKFIL